MYRSFSIKNFRCFDELTVEGMGRINLIAGKNNVGKTALLEALWVHHGAVNPDLGMRVDSFRGLEVADPENFMGNLFYGFDRNLTIHLASEGDWGDAPRLLKLSLQDSSTVEVPLAGVGDSQLNPQQSSSVLLQASNVMVMDYSNELEDRITTKGRLVVRQLGPGIQSSGLEIMHGNGQPLQGRPSGAFLAARRAVIGGEEINRYSQLEISGRQDGALQILQEVEPSLKRLTVVAEKQEPRIYADIGLGRLIPVQLMGDGISRILSLALAIATSPGGMVLVDEIENGIHHSVMEKVWKAIGAFARSYDVQLFATTHSYECIGAAYRAFESDEEDELRLFRIERNRDGKYKSVKFDRDRLKSVLEFNMEVI